MRQKTNTSTEALLGVNANDRATSTDVDISNSFNFSDNLKTVALTSLMVPLMGLAQSRRIKTIISMATEIVVCAQHHSTWVLVQHVPERNNNNNNNKQFKTWGLQNESNGSLRCHYGVILTGPTLTCRIPGPRAEALVPSPRYEAGCGRRRPAEQEAGPAT